MTVRCVAIHSIFTGVHATPFEGGTSTSGGAVSAGGNIVLPDVVKTTTNGVGFYSYGGRAAASGYTAWGAGTYTPSNYTAAGTGPTASPALAEIMVADARETTPVAAGTITGPTVALTAAHGFSAWAGRGVVLKPSGGSAPAFFNRSVYNIQDSAGTLAVALTGLANNQFSILDFTLDDATATLTPPDGTWVQSFSQTFTGGVLVRFYKQHPSSGVTAAQTINFTVSTTTSPPVNSVAPVASGTAAIGSTLSTTTGTWSNSPTSYAYQWQRDGSNISGATASTYVIPSDGGGHTFRCVVTASNAGGPAASGANSNGIAVPAAPTNSVAPVISAAGSPKVAGVVLTLDSLGTWSPTPDTYARQWYRGASPISGATGTTYTLVQSDEGANMTCRVTATTGGGSNEAVSNIITADVSAPLSDASFLFYLSGGAGNTDPALSIGGARGGTYGATLNGIFGPVIGSVAQAGGTFYAVVYPRNTHATATAAAGKLYVAQPFTDPNLQIAVAVPTEGANTTVAALASGTTAPTGVTWTTTTNPASGLDFGDLVASAYRGVYLRLTVLPGATPAASDNPDTFAIGVAFSAA